MSVTVKVEGVDKALRRLAGLKQPELDRRTRPELLAAARAQVSPISRAAPRRSGILAGSVRVTELSGRAVSVGPTARHRHWVILGTQRRTNRSGANRGVMPRNPFVGRAVNARSVASATATRIAKAVVRGA